MKTKGSLERILANLGFVLGFESHARAFGKNRDFRKEEIIILFANVNIVTKSMHQNWRKMFEDWRASGKTSLECVDKALTLTVYESSSSVGNINLADSCVSTISTICWQPVHVHPHY